MGAPAGALRTAPLASACATARDKLPKAPPPPALALTLAPSLRQRILDLCSHEASMGGRERPVDAAFRAAFKPVQRGNSVGFRVALVPAR